MIYFKINCNTNLACPLVWEKSKTCFLQFPRWCTENLPQLMVRPRVPRDEWAANPNTARVALLHDIIPDDVWAAVNENSVFTTHRLVHAAQ